jgi:hypothetical protein
MITMKLIDENAMLYKRMSNAERVAFVEKEMTFIRLELYRKKSYKVVNPYSMDEQIVSTFQYAMINFIYHYDEFHPNEHHVNVQKAHTEMIRQYQRGNFDSDAMRRYANLVFGLRFNKGYDPSMVSGPV